MRKCKKQMKDDFKNLQHVSLIPKLSRTANSKGFFFFRISNDGLKTTLHPVLCYDLTVMQCSHDISLASTFSLFDILNWPWSSQDCFEPRYRVDLSCREKLKKGRDVLLPPVLTCSKMTVSFAWLRPPTRARNKAFSGVSSHTFYYGKMTLDKYSEGRHDPSQMYCVGFKQQRWK